MSSKLYSSVVSSERFTKAESDKLIASNAARKKNRQVDPGQMGQSIAASSTSSSGSAFGTSPSNSLAGALG